MMGRHLRELVKMFGTEEGAHALNKYINMMDHEGWEVHKAMMVLLRGHIVTDLLSKKFTDLSPVEKDVSQRAYAGTVEVIDFLTNPRLKIQKANRIKTHNRKQGATGGTT